MSTSLQSRLLIRPMLFAGLFLLFSACKKNDISDAGLPPEAPADISVEAIPDGAIISYGPFSDNTAVEIVAVYTDDDGIIRTFTFDLSEHPGSITLNDKFSVKEGKRTVELYTVNAAGQHSESVMIEVEPLPPASLIYLKTVLESIKFLPTPTGISFSFENPDSKDLTFTLLVPAQEGFNKVFTSTRPGDTFFIDQLFATSVQVKIIATGEPDFSDIMSYEVETYNKTEVLLDKSTWSVEKLPGDSWEAPDANLKIENLWDGKFASPAYRFQGPSGAYPQAITIDLGENQLLGLSRIKVHHFAIGPIYVYDQFNPREYEIWGSNNPSPDGSFTGWEKIRTCNSLKPSNSPVGTVTTEDFDYIKEGEEFGFPAGTKNYRYLRFRTIQTWKASSNPYSYVRLFELTLWGTE